MNSAGGSAEIHTIAGYAVEHGARTSISVEIPSIVGVVSAQRGRMTTLLGHLGAPAERVSRLTANRFSS